MARNPPRICSAVKCPLDSRSAGKESVAPATATTPSGNICTCAFATKGASLSIRKLEPGLDETRLGQERCTLCDPTLQQFEENRPCLQEENFPRPFAYYRI